MSKIRHFCNVTLSIFASALVVGCSAEKNDVTADVAGTLLKAPEIKGLYKCPLKTTILASGIGNDTGATVYIDIDTAGYTKKTSWSADRKASKFDLTWSKVPGNGNKPEVYRIDDVVNIVTFPEKNGPPKMVRQQRFDGRNFCFAIQSVGMEPVEWYRSAESHFQYLQNAVPFGTKRIPCASNIDLSTMQYTEVTNNDLKFEGVCLPLNE